MSTTTTKISIDSAATSVPANSPIEDGIFEPHFLVVSLGNPHPHGDGLHSAGHYALQSLRKELFRNHQQPPFSSERIGKAACQASRGPKYTLLQCPTLMNISGPWVARAWKEILAEMKQTHTPLGLVVVHDDLEEDMGVVKTRDWETSHRGHNGLKSIKASMRPTDYADSRWAKIRVGIGRPAARDQNAVSNYVLRPMSKHQKAILSDKSGSPVLAALKSIEAAWVSDINKGQHGAKAKAPKKLRPQAKETSSDQTGSLV